MWVIAFIAGAIMGTVLMACCNAASKADMQIEMDCIIAESVEMEKKYLDLMEMKSE